MVEVIKMNYVFILINIWFFIMWDYVKYVVVYVHERQLN